MDKFHVQFWQARSASGGTCYEGTCKYDFAHQPNTITIFNNSEHSTVGSLFDELLPRIAKYAKRDGML